LYKLPILGTVNPFIDFLVTFFELQQRAAGDQAHADMVAALRSMERMYPITDNILNQLQILRASDCVLGNPNSFRYATIVTTTRHACAAFNKTQAIRFARDHGLPVIAFRLPLAGPGRRVFEDDELAKRLLYEAYDMLWFYFVPHAPARILINQHVPLGIANGALCTLHSIVVQPEEEERVAMLCERAQLGQVIVLDNLPVSINVKVTVPVHLRSAIPSNMTLEEDNLVVPMFLSTEDNSDNVIKHGSGVVKFFSWECALNFASTYHKTQSLTMDKVILDLQYCPHYPLQLFHFIVGVSRVRRGNDLRILPFLVGDRRHLLSLKFPADLMQWYCRQKGIPMPEAGRLYSTGKRSQRQLLDEVIY
jgi:hypothetical protein